ncbi:DUF1206 domain-containing protein [Mangrovibrevibacter kandeliae]|uniref:DUF1206 domain-containing protein n=1 Tax=Mangrovibrevibacter kandeliae TaxID=2968473 RepID=UPI002118CD90|nr:DUF1206 domain-containing protein [Aurantimonas sp. CSK15Z-1]MCQ8781909.1 DUF1206 domain-containing protein [Aurantimonas sp. CSK15Z-1]
MEQQGETPQWVDPMMRGGYAARGVVNFLVGVFAFGAAWYETGEAEGTTGALKSLLGGGLGIVLLVLIAVGLAAYAAWRVTDAWLDLEDHGLDPAGLLARSGMVITGLFNLGLAGYALSLIWTANFSFGGSGDSSGGSGGASGAKGVTAWVMSLPYGRWAIAAAGLVILGAGLYFFRKAWSGSYKQHLECTRLSERLDPLAKIGLVAEGIVIAIIGGFFVWAGWTADPNQAGGLGEALRILHQQAYGRVLLGAVAIGLMLYCLYCLIEAVYRFIPRLKGADTLTLADRWQDKAERQLRELVD